MSLVSLIWTACIIINLLVLSSAQSRCYYFTEELPDPCDKMNCDVAGALCERSMDGKAARCVCPKHCESFGDHTEAGPVCGSDGRDYDNICELRKLKCEQLKNITLKYKGKCDPCGNKTCSYSQTCQLDNARNAVCECDMNSCPEDIREVCGNNGRTYSNECFMRIDGCKNRKTYRVLHEGPCNGNEGCGNLTCRHYSECVIVRGQVGQCVCPSCESAYHRPVCGSDGITYDNRCDLMKKACHSKEDVEVMFFGNCSEVCNSSKCRHYSECVIDDVQGAHCECPSCEAGAHEPVCGSDDVTYENSCDLMKKACHANKDVSVKFFGTCADGGLCVDFKCAYGAECKVRNNKPICECPKCSEEHYPVCGTDGITYANKCKLLEENCRKQKKIHVAYQGACNGCEKLKCEYYSLCVASGGKAKCVCPSTCVLDNKPVCGTDGVTYGNECQLELASCKKQQSIRVSSKGTCAECKDVVCENNAVCDSGVCVCPKTCPNYRDVVCASNGVTYDNRCMMQRAACELGIKLTVVEMKECEEDMSGSGSETCNCYSLGSLSPSCNSQTGQCVCKPGVAGRHCDHCEPGFWGLRKIKDGNTGCLACKCNIYGSLTDDCEQESGHCVCLPAVFGDTCDQCDDGFVGPGGCISSSQLPASCSQQTCLHGATCMEEGGQARCICNMKCSASQTATAVCASNGKTYKSRCDIKQFACRLQQDIRFVSDGPCRDSFFRRSTRHIRSTKPLPEPPTQKPGSINIIEKAVQAMATSMQTTQTPSTKDAGLLAFSFFGNSFLQLNFNLNAKKQLTIEMELLSLKPDGLLMYCGLNNKDFISLSLVDSFVEFRYHLGSGVNIIRSRSRITLGVFTHVVAKRKERVGVLMVGGQRVTSGSSKPGARELNLHGANIFLGNVDALSKFAYKQTGTSQGFEGCIKAFKVDGSSWTKIYSLQLSSEDIVTSFNVVSEGIDCNSPVKFDGSTWLEYSNLGIQRKKSETRNDISLRFKTSSQNGLLLIIHKSNSVSGDYLTLAVVGGRLELSYNLGMQSAANLHILRSGVRVNDGKWHKVHITRNHRKGHLFVDNQYHVTGVSKVGATMLDTDGKLFMGGKKNLPTGLPAGYYQGFRGCITDVKINSYDLHMARDQDSIMIKPLNFCE